MGNLEEFLSEFEETQAPREIVKSAQSNLFERPVYQPPVWGASRPGALDAKRIPSRFTPGHSHYRPHHV